jgi:hypothetical protein
MAAKLKKKAEYFYHLQRSGVCRQRKTLLATCFPGLALKAYLNGPHIISLQGYEVSQWTVGSGILPFILCSWFFVIAGMALLSLSNKIPIRKNHPPLASLYKRHSPCHAQEMLSKRM